MKQSMLPLLAAVVLLTNGCALMPKSVRTSFSNEWTRTGAPSMATSQEGAIPSSSRSYAEALTRASAMAAGDATLRVAQVAATGSMRPYLGESSLVVLERPDLTNLKVGQILSYTRAGAEYIHILVAVTPNGAVMKGSSPKTEELVPFGNITGATLSVIYFDKSTALSDRSGLPLLLAASGDEIPPTAGTLRVVDAEMVSGLKAAVVYPLGSGEYKVALEHNDALGLTLGVPSNLKIPSAQVNINWAPSLVGKTVKFQIYHPEAPETGVVLVYTSFLP